MAKMTYSYSLVYILVVDKLNKRIQSITIPWSWTNLTRIRESDSWGNAQFAHLKLSTD